MLTKLFFKRLFYWHTKQLYRSVLLNISDYLYRAHRLHIYQTLFCNEHEYIRAICSACNLSMIEEKRELWNHRVTPTGEITVGTFLVCQQRSTRFQPRDVHTYINTFDGTCVSHAYACVASQEQPERRTRVC